MKVNLTKREAEYLRSAPFWDWKRAELDIRFEELWLGDNKLGTFLVYNEIVRVT